MRGLIVRQGLTPVAIGVVAGLAGGIAVAKVVSSLLFGVSPGQPGVIGAVAAIVLLVGIAACVEPAVRAARTPLVSALRRT